MSVTASMRSERFAGFSSSTRARCCRTADARTLSTQSKEGRRSMVDFERYEAIEVRRDGPILTVTFNRPEQLNAINRPVHRELETLFTDADVDDDVKLVVLTGKGRAFSAGGDLDWLLE